MDRVYYLRWYFAFVQECDWPILDSLFVHTPLVEDKNEKFRPDLRLSGPNSKDEFCYHCLWRAASEGETHAWQQQGKLHRSGGKPAMIVPMPLYIELDLLPIFNLLHLLPDNPKSEIVLFGTRFLLARVWFYDKGKHVK
jgi:hypothetical protein